MTTQKASTGTLVATSGVHERRDKAQCSRYGEALFSDTAGTVGQQAFFGWNAGE